MRAVPHLGPGRGARRRRSRASAPIAAASASRWSCPSGASLWFVGPDNGLLVAAAEAAAEAPMARRGRAAPRRSAPPDRGSTFDGRDLFGPAAAALCTGAALEDAGRARRPGVAGATDRWRGRRGTPARRARLPARGGDVGRPLRQSAAGGDGGRRPGGGHAVDGLRRAGRPRRVGPSGPRRVATFAGARRRALRCVDAFGELEQGEFGLLVDANGHLAVVAGEASAAHWLNVVAGELLVLAW